jgi:hypothetical protein
MLGNLTLPYKSEDGRIELYGRDWLDEPRTWKDVIRCRLGRHKAVLWGYTEWVRFSERCSCGAMGDGRGWVCLDKQAGRRKAGKGA